MTLYNEQGWPERGHTGPAVVALGGGHGLSATLRALRHITHRLTAVVTVADDGGSSGRLRQELDILPPGDLRMALASLCDESEWGLTWRDVLQVRFDTAGDLNNHSVGNLLIAALWQLLGDEIDGLDWVAKLLGAHGRVLPMAAVPLEIEADVVRDGEHHLVRGQSKVAVTPGKVEHVRLIPPNPPVPLAVSEAVEEADWIVLGPGSWYTSVIPHLQVDSLADSLVNTKARRALICNLSIQKGETEGMGVADHIRVLQEHAPKLRLDVIIIDPSVADDYDEVAETAAKCGAKLLLRQVRIGDGTPKHDPLRLAAALRDAFEGYLGEVGYREPWSNGMS